VRHDCGIYEGWDVPVYYDPILSKLIVHAGDREAARQRMLRALTEMSILGIETTVEYLRAIIESEAFARGDTQTDFIEKHMGDWVHAAAGDDLTDVAAIAGALVLASGTERAAVAKREVSPWDLLGSWTIGGGR
jgi:acetyl-CoA carboxylase biotin carboxylase subunit